MRTEKAGAGRIGIVFALLLALSVLVGCQTKEYSPVMTDSFVESEESAEETVSEDVKDGGETAPAVDEMQETADFAAEGLQDGSTGLDGQNGSDGREGSDGQTVPESEAETAAVTGIDPAVLGLEPTEAAEDPYTRVDETVTVTADVLNVRVEADPNAPIYAQLKQGTRLHRTGVLDGWSRVLFEGKTCYVASDMVERTGDAPETAAGGLWGEREPAAEAPFNGHTVAVDAGYQAKGNSEREPVGPSSDTMHAKMSEGSTGTVTGVKESELTLEVARRLKEALEKKGYRVVMTRETNDVDISNAERAELANESGAEILIRLHANSMENSGVYGALTMCMTAQNPYNAELHDRSHTLSKLIVDAICSQTGTKNRGVQEVDNSAAINWSKIPVSDVAMGFLSNPDEDRWLQDGDYQEKIVSGIAQAVDSYFAAGN